MSASESSSISRAQIARPKRRFPPEHIILTNSVVVPSSSLFPSVFLHFEGINLKSGCWR
jgi:hypothetical protein